MSDENVQFEKPNPINVPILIEEIEALTELAACRTDAERFFVNSVRQRIARARRQSAMEQSQRWAERSQEAEQAAPRQYTAGNVEAVEELGQHGEVEEHRPLGGYPDSYLHSKRNGPEPRPEGIRNEGPAP